MLVGVRAGRSSTASDQRARGRSLQHRSDDSQVVLSCEEVTTGLGLGVEWYHSQIWEDFMWILVTVVVILKIWMTDWSHDGFQEVPGIQLYLITMSHLVPPLKQEMLVQLEKLLNSFSVRNWYKILYMKQIRYAEQNRNYASRSLRKLKCNILVIIV